MENAHILFRPWVGAWGSDSKLLCCCERTSKRHCSNEDVGLIHEYNLCEK